ncbi:MAG: Gfo/Idh/MocA family oxidoreductase [Candidatus Hydrogenedentes bacterium]|nr:Gfo/Idh/MocA family oxidoreductase [Candidatus Hydrogenedentota bacterium]
MKRIIQVGVGSMGRVWTDRVADSRKWETVAYVDTNRRALAEAAARHKVPKSRCYTDLSRALREVEADALLDVTPPKIRKGVCCAAFEHGLHVLSEKPLADSVANAKAIVTRAARYKRTYMVAQNYRFQAPTQTAKRFLESGKLGDVGYAGVRFHKGPHFGGFREEMAYPLVLDMSIHHVDMMRCILGADVYAVQAVSVNAPWNWNKGDATILAQVEMDNGIAVNYFGSWVASGWETPWNADWRIEGSKGALLWENDEFFFSNKASKRRAVPQVKWPVVHQAYVLKAFGDALEKGEEPETSGRRNLNSFAATYAIVRAVREKRRVLVSELLE